MAEEKGKPPFITTDTWTRPEAEECISPAELRSRRTLLGLSRKELARALGVVSNTVARWERGELAIANPSLVSRALERLRNERSAIRYSPRTLRAGRRARSRPSRAASNLPRSLSAPIGRDGEIEDIRRQVLETKVRLLTLTGPGGCGKTRLAIAAAESLLTDFEDGVYFVDLSPIREANMIASAIALTLGLRDVGQRPVSESLLRFLQRRQLLLVLDNFEQVLDGAPFVSELLRRCPGLAVLATSREALHLRWERILLVDPLAMPNLEHLPEPTALAQVPAVALFIERTRRLRSGFELTAANIEAVAEICVMLDGLPLAIQLAAARGRLLSPQELLGRLQARLDFLRGSSRDRAERHRSLRETLDWSYELLDRSQQMMFRRLGVFVGGFSSEAACTVSNIDGVPCLDTLEALVDKSLLRVDFVEDRPRFRMLDTIRDYALEQLETNEELQTTEQRHANHYLTVAEQAAMTYFGPFSQFARSVRAGARQPARGVTLGAGCKSG
jgi:predicted ATPase/DNA-binding XRE family transcriptional regulator